MVHLTLKPITTNFLLDQPLGQSYISVNVPLIW